MLEWLNSTLATHSLHPETLLRPFLSVPGVPLHEEQCGSGGKLALFSLCPPCPSQRLLVISPCFLTPPPPALLPLLSPEPHDLSQGPHDNFPAELSGPVLHTLHTLHTAVPWEKAFHGPLSLTEYSANVLFWCAGTLPVFLLFPTMCP